MGNNYFMSKVTPLFSLFKAFLHINEAFRMNAIRGCTHGGVIRVLNQLLKEVTIQ